MPQILFIDAYDSFSNNIVSLLRDSIPDSTISVIKIDDPRFFARPASSPSCELKTRVLPAIGCLSGHPAASLPSQCLTPPGEFVSVNTDHIQGAENENASINCSGGIDYAAFYSFISRFDAVVAGPGPGHPSIPTDVGVIPALWQQNKDNSVPVLGICLGFQSLAQHAGLRVAKLPEARHGLVVPITHWETNDRLFKNVPSDDCIVTVYHSLGVRFGKEDSNNRSQVPSLSITDDGRVPFQTPGKSFIPLAWDLTSNDNGPVLMAMKHLDGPFWGVQYHPESVCTNSSGQKILHNWWQMATEWNCGRNSNKTSRHNIDTVNNFYETPVPDEDNSRMRLLPAQNLGFSLQARALSYSSRVQSCALSLGVLTVPDLIRTLKLPTGSSEAIVFQSARKQSLPDGRSGATSRPDERDRFSILAVVDSCSLRMFYSVRTGMLDLRIGSGAVVSSTRVPNIWEYLAAFMAPFRASTGSPAGISGGSENVPFWGGLMGFLSYEAGLESLGIAPSGPDSQAADLSFVFVHRSVVVDHYSDTVFVQSIQASDDDWVCRVSRRIQVVEANKAQRASPLRDEMLNDEEESPFATWVPSERLVDHSGHEILPPAETHPQPPSVGAEVKSYAKRDEYSRQIKDCQELIREGESYELCLTNQIAVSVPLATSVSSSVALGEDATLAQLFDFVTTAGVGEARSTADWKLYNYSSHVNPAPYSAFLRLDRADCPPGNVGARGAHGKGLTVVSCSPEKFLSWTREGKCQMRPIKGTLGKWDWARLSEVLTAEEIASIVPHCGRDGDGWSKEKIPSPLARLYFEKNIKERAENLMIVDLIRHDLHGVAKGRVEVPGCMVTEEYEAVYQLVSVIEAELDANSERPDVPNETTAEGNGCNNAISQGAQVFPILAIPADERSDHISSGPRAYPLGLSSNQPTGLSVLSAALPPGSMTGAPKLRSCQLLAQIERGDRGVYSGVIGYLDVGGAGHFNVVIRTGVRWDWECEVEIDVDSALLEGNNGDGERRESGSTMKKVRVSPKDGLGAQLGQIPAKHASVKVSDIWHVGAGGAITAKSDPDDEVDEMMLKARSTLRMFGVGM